MHLTLSIPLDWFPALLGQGTHHMYEAERTAFDRWLADMQHEFGEVALVDHEAGTFTDPWNEGTEYGASPRQRCRNAVLLVS